MHKLSATYELSLDVRLMNNIVTERILKSTRMPARLTADEAAARLGFQPHDIPVLVGAKLLKPLGRCNRLNSPKYFATVSIEESASDVQWLSKATDAIKRNWRIRNDRKQKQQSEFDGMTGEPA